MISSSVSFPGRQYFGSVCPKFKAKVSVFDDQGIRLKKQLPEKINFSKINSIPLKDKSLMPMES